VETARTRAEFEEAAKGLPRASGLGGTVVLIEPLEGRSTLDVERRCIVEERGRRYVARWD